MNKSELTIITNGDSWVFGCEIVDSKLSNTYPHNTHPGVYDYLEANDEYRIPKIFPTHLGNLMNANIINLSYPADDNGTILRRTLTFITNNYIAKNKSTDNLLVIIGWSSPERNSFWYKDEKISRPFRLWPQVAHFDADPQEEFWKLYVQYLWNIEEYIPRYILDVLQFQNFCNSYNIKWLCFNSFYQTPNKNVTDWYDLDISKEAESIRQRLGGFPFTDSRYGNRRFFEFTDYTNIWNTIDPIRFYKKNQPNNTFKSYIQDPVNKIDNILNGWHPSPESHLAWANELQRYIKENKLL